MYKGDGTSTPTNTRTVCLGEPLGYLYGSLTNCEEIQKGNT
jgi:hypothetical protein